jgi:hypothetical protein
MMNRELIKLEPKLEDLILEFASQPDQLEPFITVVSASPACCTCNLLTRSQFNIHAGAARQEDTGRLKRDIVDYLMPRPSMQMVSPPISKDAKSRRGFNHPITARFLCPIRRIPTFDRDPRYVSTPSRRLMHCQSNCMNLVAPSCQRQLTAPLGYVHPNGRRFSMIPLPHMIPTTRKMAYLEDTCFFGYVFSLFFSIYQAYIIKAYRHIFTSPTSAIDGRRDATKQSKAQIHNLTAVTGRTIAYAAVQVHFYFYFIL